MRTVSTTLLVIGVSLLSSLTGGPAVRAQEVTATRVSHRERPDGRPRWPEIAQVIANGGDVVITVRLAREFRGPAPTVTVQGNVLRVRANGARPATCGNSRAFVHDVYEVRVRGLAPGAYSVTGGVARNAVSVNVAR